MSKGEILYNYRKDNNLSQQELADKLFVTRQAVSIWERNITIPNPSNLEIVYSQIGLNIDEIFIKNKVKNGEKKMEIKDIQKEVVDYSVNKYDTAIGLFYSIGLFIGMLVTTILVQKNGFNDLKDLIYPVIYGLLIFFIIGLVIHAIITLIRK